MRYYTTLLLAILGLGCCSLISGQYYSPIYSDNGLPWRGIEGPRDLCPGASNYSFAYAMDFKFDDLNDLDNVGGNAVKLFCRSDDGSTVGYITSIEGKRGVWQGIRSCAFGEYFNGFRLRVFPDQGTWGDDFAVDNIQLSCSDGTIVDGMEGVLMSPHKPKSEHVEEDVVRERVEMMGRMMEKIRAKQGSRLHGNWGTWVYCSPNHFIAGIKTVVEEGHINDDAGLTDVILYCLLE